MRSINFITIKINKHYGVINALLGMLYMIINKNVAKYNSRIVKMDISNKFNHKMLLILYVKNVIKTIS